MEERIIRCEVKEVRPGFKQISYVIVRVTNHDKARNGGEKASKLGNKIFSDWKSDGRRTGKQKGTVVFVNSDDTHFKGVMGFEGKGMEII